MHSRRVPKGSPTVRDPSACGGQRDARGEWRTLCGEKYTDHQRSEVRLRIAG
jgi:hypothetical protein